MKIVVLLHGNGIDDTMRLTIGRKRRQVTIIEVADMTVEVERKWIKNLYLRVSPTNARIRVSAPMMMSEEAIRRFVLSKEAWIRQRVKRTGEKKQPTPREYVSGEVHYYKGHGYTLKVVYRNGPAKVETEGNEYIILFRYFCCLNLFILQNSCYLRRL